VAWHPLPGANIDCQTFAGKSALHFAAEHKLPELVEASLICLTQDAGYHDMK